MTPEGQQEFMRLCEDIHAMMAENRKGMDDCITILNRMIAAQEAWETGKLTCAQKDTRRIIHDPRDVQRINKQMEYARSAKTVWRPGGGPLTVPQIEQLSIGIELQRNRLELNES
jgi:hypothetical protein